MKLIIKSSINGELTENEFEGMMDETGNKIRLKYRDCIREMNCSLVFSRFDSGFFRLRENQVERGLTVTEMDCNKGEGEIKVHIGENVLDGILIRDFFSEVSCENLIKFGYSLIYTKEHTAKIKFVIEMKDS